ncbi:hydroxyacid dehydrogenase [Halocella sp. SP3-1]|uniref:hydroxyacid dehydrogenase n=1 Tax=Halocella sp. SP3-1 TaxID=2382161 RepID=UPI000F74EC0B|nr:hydroxyacid dehydrogenase [Halocella sp. SP3-1]AZO93520.1 hypothetical protein D7D81_02305 [Halocella sp. SP3-1]
MYKILVTKPIHPIGMKILREKADVAILSSVENMEEESKDKDAIILRIGNVTKSIIEGNPNLKVIAKHGVGVDEIDVETATKFKIPVVNAPGANADSVAEHTIAMLLALVKNIRNSDINLRKGKFNYRDSAKPVGLEGKTFGVAGYGQIGKKVVEKSRGFNMNTIVYDPYAEINENQEVEFCDSIDTLFKKSDIVSLHMPLTKETINLITYKQLKLLGEKGYLINCARGEVICQSDLSLALENEIIAGAALDVFDKEPPDINEKLFSYDNIIVTPHMAALSEEAIIKMSTMVSRGVLKVLEGEMPENVVNLNQITY